MVARAGGVDDVSHREAVHGLRTAAGRLVPQHANAIAHALGRVVQEGILPDEAWCGLDIDMRARCEWREFGARGVGEIEGHDILRLLKPRDDSHLPR